jgi:hypothetical protein
VRSVLAPDSWPEEVGGFDEWAPLVSEREDMGGVPVRNGEKLGAAWLTWEQIVLVRGV